MRGPGRPLRTLAAAAVTALALAFPPTAGAAAGDVTFTPDPVVAGQQVSTTVSAEGVGPRSFPCDVSIDDIAVTPDSCVQVEGTTASVTFTVPPETVAGSHTVTLLVYKSTFTGSLDVTRLVPVPELRPLRRDRALAAVDKAGLRWCPTGQDSGYVVQQSPAPATQAAEGSCVTVTLADGVVVPDLQRLHPKRARAALAQFFLILDAPAGDGLIAGQDPPAGTTVPPSTVVSVTFAVPPPTSPATSPPVPTKPATAPPQPTQPATPPATRPALLMPLLRPGPHRCPRPRPPRPPHRPRCPGRSGSACSRSSPGWPRRPT